MWESVITPSHRKLSVRRIIAYVMAVMAAAFSWALINTTLTHAADASWVSSSTITYQNNTYNGPATPETVQSLNLAKGTKAYTFVDLAATDDRSKTSKMHVIYFDESADVSTVKSANYKTYTYNGPSSFSDPSPPAVITITDQSKSSSSQGNTSCAVDGIGWLVCPISNFLASSMDYMYDVVSSFLVVRPVITDPNTTLFRAWSYMRSFANIAFAIGFLIIIYSQLTSYGISNYGIKKLLPRLIVAAILVNISYYICAIAVDISNVFGYSLQDMFMGIRSNLVGTANSGNFGSWSSVTGFILSGGTAVTAGAIGLVTTLATYGVAGSIFLLLPVLLSGLLAVLTALLVLAGRQAMITVLIIIAPLAFVAYLLPNTEKWFEKWKSTFLTMLILFPAFSLVFGGAQLAAAAIIQNADNINLVILGMMIQVMPLMITPLLIKLSGSTLGQLANFANRMQKLPMDKTREFTADRAKNIEARRLGTTARSRLQSYAQHRDHNRRRREAWRGAHTGMADARWAKSGDFSNVDQAIREAADQKKLGEGRSELRYNQSRVNNTRVNNLDRQLRQVKLDNDNTNLQSDLQWEQDNSPRVAEQKLALRTLTDQVAEAKAIEDAKYKVLKTREYQNTQDYQNQSAAMKQLIDQARSSAEGVAIHTMQAQSADSFKQKEIAEILKNSEFARKVAGAAIIDGQHGPIRVEAAALSALSKAESENVTNQVTLLGMRAAEANTTLKNYSSDIVRRAITGTSNPDENEDIITAAFEAQAQEGNMSIFEEAKGSRHINPRVQSAISKVIARNSGAFKAKGGFHLQADPQLNISDNPNYWQDIQASRLGTLGNVSATQIKDLKGGWLDDMSKYMTDPTNENNPLMAAALDNPANRASIQKIYDSFMLALNDDGIRGSIGDRIEAVEKIAAELESRGFTQSVKPSGQIPGNGPAHGATGPHPTP